MKGLIKYHAFFLFLLFSLTTIGGAENNLLASDKPADVPYYVQAQIALLDTDVQAVRHLRLMGKDRIVPAVPKLLETFNHLVNENIFRQDRFAIQDRPSKLCTFFRKAFCIG